jgi:hypothetical protein
MLFRNSGRKKPRNIQIKLFLKNISDQPSLDKYNEELNDFLSKTEVLDIQNLINTVSLSGKSESTIFTIVEYKEKGITHLLENWRTYLKRK